MAKKISIVLVLLVFILGCDPAKSQKILVKIKNNGSQDLEKIIVMDSAGSKDFDKLSPGETGRFKTDIDKGLHLTLIYSIAENKIRTETINKYFEGNTPDHFLISIDNEGRIRY